MDEIAEARALLDEAPAVDLHADTPLLLRFGWRLAARGRPILARRSLFGHLDLPRMAEGGLWAQFFGLVTFPLRRRGLAAACHRRIDDLAREVARNRDRIRPCLTAEHVLAARREGARAALLGIEGAHALEGRLDRLAEFARRGVRYLGLLHFSANEAGFPAMGWGRDDARGLTPFGHALLDACAEHGVLVDLTHTNRRGFFEAVERAKGPLIVSHTGVSGVRPHWRNLDDEQIRAVAKTGGVVGLIFAARFLGGETTEALVRHIRHVIAVGGEDTPALGSDFDGCVKPLSDLKDTADLPRLVAALRRAGLADEAIRKIAGRNALRVLAAVPPRTGGAAAVDPERPFGVKNAALDRALPPPSAPS
jgi:membrane dipeptidase